MTDIFKAAFEIISKEMVTEFRECVSFLNKVERRYLFGSTDAVKADMNQIIHFNKIMKCISNDLLLNVKDHYDDGIYIIDNIPNIIDNVNKIDKVVSGKLSFPDMTYVTESDFLIGWEFSLYNRTNSSEKLSVYAISTFSVNEIKETEVHSVLPNLIADAINNNSAQICADDEGGTYINKFPCKFCIEEYR